MDQANSELHNLTLQKSEGSNDNAISEAARQPSIEPSLGLGVQTDRMTDDDDMRVTDRTTSPPPYLSPSLALDACPQLDRSVSTASSVSSASGRSTSSRLSDSSLSAARRRGYMRPQATTFSDSARNRDSVLSLGSIAHLQYYFARTGLLDGKGAQLLRGNSQDIGKRKSSSDSRGSSRAVSMSGAETPSGGLSADPDVSYAVSDAGLVDSPVDGEGIDTDWDQDPAMCPPTVSTYNHRTIYVPPPPDLTMLRRELTEALEDALKVLKESDKCPDGLFFTARLLITANHAQTPKAGTRFKACTSSM